MTVTPQNSSPQPASSSQRTTTRSGGAQMDESDGLRLRLSSEDSLSPAPSLSDPINLEDSHYALLRGELEFDAQRLEAESWSVAAEQTYLKALSKEAVKRQDVIYELMQTEMHHVRTLKILHLVYMHELRQSHLIEEERLQWLFPRVDSLLSLHQHFLNCLKVRQSQSQSLEEGNPNNYQVTQLGDILLTQFSDALGEGMTECYSIFCSHQNKAIGFYKEQLQNNKKLQILMRKLGQLPLVRRLGIPECFLLVTQRITKYPVLVERIIQNTEADTDEHQSLVQALAQIRDSISQVNTQVSEYEKADRLKDILLRLDPKSHGRRKDNRPVRREELMNEDRTLLHEGVVTWKSSGKQKEIHAVLLSDALLLLQEKDQKLVFAAVDNKPSAVSLQGLIVREVAHDDRAMFLICACTSTLPEMYEMHTGSREERVTWMSLIREAVERYPQEELHREMILKLQHFQEALQERDVQIIQSLTEKQQIFAALYESVMEQETPHRGLLLRGDTSEGHQGETLLRGAIDEVETLQSLLLSSIKDPEMPTEESAEQGGPPGPAETSGGGDGDSLANALKSADEAEGSATTEDSPTTSSPQLRDALHPEGLELSDDDATPESEVTSVSCHLPEEEICDRVIMLAQMLHSLQAIVAQQDSQMELQRAFQSGSQQPTRHYSHVLLEQEKQRSLEKQKEQLANLHKLQAQQLDERRRWEREREAHRAQAEALEAQLQRRAEECRQWEEKLAGEQAELTRQWGNYQQDLERLRESTKSVEKERERLTQEKERLEQLQEKLKVRLQNLPGHGNYDELGQHHNLFSYPSFRGRIFNGGGSLSLTPKPSMSLHGGDPKEMPPKVPPRRESISAQPAKAELPVHLISTTNQVLNPPAVQQQIPTKLATLSKGKDKGFRSKGSHQRTNSAASIDVSQLLPIRVMGKEGGSLRAARNDSPQRIYHSESFKPPGTSHGMKVSPSIKHTPKRSSSELPPPAPPPFPKEVLEKGKEKVTFL